MNDIAIRLGWVAINASRIETLVAYLQVVLGKEESEVVGAPWSSNYDSCKAAYRQLHDTALQRGDSAEAEHSRLFLDVLIELNGWMLDRHHVLHAIWEQDPALEPGVTLAMRRRGRRVSGAWPINRLDALNRYLEAAHGAVMAEMARLLNRQDPHGRSGPEH